MILRRAEEWPALFRFLEQYKEQPIPKSGLEVIVRAPKSKRSLDQNALSHVWYATVSAAEKEYSAAEVKRLCKLHYGIPILREDPEASEMLQKILGPLSYEERLKAMDWIDVTSVLDKDQMSNYMMAIQNHYSGRVDLR